MKKSSESRNSSPEFRCRYCDKQYKFESGLLSHSCKAMPIKTDEGFKCQRCEKTYKLSSGFDKHICKPSNPVASSTFVCPYCKKGYTQEKKFIGHICQQKKRMYERDTKPALLAFHAFSLFWKMSYRTDATYEKFAKSNLYDAFLRFGKYIIDVDAISPKDYIEYMIKSSVPIDRWCRDAEYEKYVRNHTMKETPLRAFERTALLMEEWGVIHKENWRRFFIEISAGLAVQWIRSGRISPWVILNCKTGQDLIRSLTDEQLELVSEALNTKLWQGKFSRFPSEVKEIQEALKIEGL